MPTSSFLRLHRGSVGPRTLVAAALSLLTIACAPDSLTESETARAEASDGTVAYVSGALGDDVFSVAAIFNHEDSELALTSRETGPLGYSTERYRTTRDGLDIVSGELVVTRDPSGQLVSASGSSWDEAGYADTPRVSEGVAAQAALSATRGGRDTTAAKLVYVAPSAGGPPVLAWQVRVVGSDGELPIADLVYIDAVSGSLVDRHPQIHTAKNRITRDAGNTETTGNVARTEGQGPTGDIDIDLAHDAAGETYDCLLALFGRTSYDNVDSPLTSIANFGVDYQNAFWTEEQKLMVYGDNFAVIDVGTHEFGHAVTSSTSALVYQNEPGALNEAASDILAAICNVYAGGSITASTWLVGEDIAGGPFRNMADPTSIGDSTDHYDTRYQGDLDFGGVHLNSGIANLQFVLMVQGGSHPRRVAEQTVVPIGIEKAGQIFFRAQTTKLGPNATFAVARAAYEEAAVELYGPNSSEHITVQEAFFAVGVGGPPQSRNEPAPEPEPEPGDEPDGPNPGESGGPTGNLEGGCSVGGGGLPSGFALLGLIALVAFVRRKM